MLIVSNRMSAKPTKQNLEEVIPERNILKLNDRDLKIYPRLLQIPKILNRDLKSSGSPSELVKRKCETFLNTRKISDIYLDNQWALLSIIQIMFLRGYCTHLLYGSRETNKFNITEAIGMIEMFSQDTERKA